MSKKSLQKFTYEQVLNKEKVTRDDVDELPKAQIDKLQKYCEEQIYTLKGEELDRFMKKIDAIISKDTKNVLYEYNRKNILVALNKHLRDYNGLPTTNQLSEATGLSRQTVSKHLKDYRNTKYFTAEQDKYQLMAGQIMTMLYNKAMSQDVKASRLFLEYSIGKYCNSTNTHINKQQNNFVQMNGILINDAVAKKLSLDQLNTIKSILKSASIDTIEFKEM